MTAPCSSLASAAEHLARMVTAALQEGTDPQRGLTELARKLLLTLMDHDSDKADLESYADQAVRTFLRAYSVPPVSEDVSPPDATRGQ